MSSSSPPSAPTKRPVRTYGRPKPATEVPASTSPAFASGSILDASPTTDPSDAPGKPQTTSEGPSSSSVEAADEGGNSDDEGGNDASSKFQWGWTHKMKALDDSEDEELSQSAPKETLLSRVMTSEGPKLGDSAPLSLGQSMGEESRNSAILPSSTPPSTSQTIFSSSAPTLPASPPPDSIYLRRVSKHKRVFDSDAESDQERSKASYSSSPVKHAINTPQNRSSTTPPTSDGENDMPSAKAKPKSKPPSKGKSTAAPLTFEPANDVDLSSSRASNKVKRAKSNKIKAPTKKELRETARERQRLAATKQVSIDPVQGSKKFTMQNLLDKVSRSAPAPLKGELSIDPISEFSSPGRDIYVENSSSRTTSSERVHTENLSLMERMSSVQKTDTLMDAKPMRDIPDVLPHNDSEDELPSIQQMLDEQKVKALKEKKLKLAQRQQQSRLKGSFSDDDDELEIVGGPSTDMQVMMKKEEDERKSGRPSIGKSTRTHQRFAKISTRSLPKPVASASEARNPKQLNDFLIKNIRSESALATKAKSEEWQRRGGKPLESGFQESAIHGIERYAQKGLENLTKAKVKTDEDKYPGEDEEEEEDTEWTPDLRGSASPVPHERGSDDEFGAISEHHGAEDQDITMVNEEAEEDDESTQVEALRRRSVRQTVNSDTEEENDENAPPPLGKVLVQDSMVLPLPVHHQSDSSHDGATEDEGDKENNDLLMYDRSEDKENTAVVRYGVLDAESSRPMLGRRQSSLYNLEERMGRSLSMSPGRGGYSTEEDKENSRSPLKTLSTAEVEPLTPASVPFAARLQRASSAATIGDDISEPFAPRVLGRDHQVSGFSQFSEDGEDFQPKSLEGSFSDLFESASQKPSLQAGTLRELEKPNNFLDKLRGKKSLALTQDIAVGLQPALEVSENLKRQAQKIFEKEQEFILDDENQPSTKQPELYINDEGFLTQTRPAGTAEIYRPPPTPSQAFSQLGNFTSQSTSRQPFRELPTPPAVDFAENTPGPSQPNRLQRLRKRGSSRSPFRIISEAKVGRRSLTPSPPVSPSEKRSRNVDRYKVPKPRQPLMKSVFVESEAQESDEEESFGFGKPLERDEEDGEDQNRTLETLVDDKEMDQAEIAEDKVMEKYQEHRQEDDIRAEVLANAVIQGEKRYGKRTRDRAGIDDSDEDEDEDERNARIRKKMKEPELRGDIKSLAGHEATRAFAEQYQSTIMNDGDPELAHLQGDDNNDIIMVGTDHGRNEDEDDGNVGLDDENDRYVSVNEVNRQIREAVANGEDEGPDFNPHDTSFLDAYNDDDDDLPPVRTIHAPIRSRGTRMVADPLDMDITENHKSESMIDDSVRQRAQTFVKNESRLRRAGTRSNMSGGSISVTGHGKTGGSTSRAGANSATLKRAPIKAAPSMLNQLDRRDLFK